MAKNFFRGISFFKGKDKDDDSCDLHKTYSENLSSVSRKHSDIGFLHIQPVLKDDDWRDIVSARGERRHSAAFERDSIKVSVSSKQSLKTNKPSQLSKEDLDDKGGSSKLFSPKVKKIKDNDNDAGHDGHSPSFIFKLLSPHSKEKKINDSEGECADDSSKILSPVLSPKVQKNKDKESKIFSSKEKKMSNLRDDLDKEDDFNDHVSGAFSPKLKKTPNKSKYKIAEKKEVNEGEIKIKKLTDKALVNKDFVPEDSVDSSLLAHRIDQIKALNLPKAQKVKCYDGEQVQTRQVRSESLPGRPNDLEESGKLYISRKELFQKKQQVHERPKSFQESEEKEGVGINMLQQELREAVDPQENDLIKAATGMGVSGFLNYTKSNEGDKFFGDDIFSDDSFFANSEKGDEYGMLPTI